MPPTDPVLPLRGTELLWGEQYQRAHVHGRAYYPQLLDSGRLNLSHSYDLAALWGLDLKPAWSCWLPGFLQL